MRIMKKTIAAVLAMMIMVLMIPFSGASALESTSELVLDTFMSLKLSGDNVTVSFVVPEDGFYRFFSIGKSDTYATLYDSQENYLNENDDVDIESGDYNFSISYKLSAGETYYLSVNSWEAEYSTQSTKIKVEKTAGIASSKIVSLPDDTTCIEGYEYMTFDLSGLAIDYTFTDGSVVNWVYGEEWNVKDFEIINDSEIDDEGNFFAIINCGGIIDMIGFTKVENPVDYIEYVGSDIEIYVNSGGYYNEYLGYYYYYLDFPKDSYVVVHYKDGSAKKTKIWEMLDGYRVEPYANQTEKPWEIGENTAYIYYLGVKTEVTVNILPPPFKSITLNRVPTKDYVFGDMRYGTLTENQVYMFYPGDIKGLSFTVEYHDGSTRTFYDKDFDIENGTIDGYEYSVTECSAAVAKSCLTTLSYMGYEIKYYVDVVESPISDLEVVWYPDLTDYDESYYPIFDGMEVEISYKDGTKKNVVFSDENTSYGEDGLFSYTVNTGTEEINIAYGWDYMGDRVYILCCYDKYVEYSGIAFYEDEKVKSVEVSDFSFENMTINITYENDSSETLDGRIVSINEFEEGRYSAKVKTEKGILFARIDTIYDNSEITGYEINILDHTAYVSGQLVTKGDVDMNGEINIVDATKIQRYLAKYETLNEQQLSAADVDSDSVITIIDVSCVQKYAAKVIENF